MIKIAILSWLYYNNYGTVLQAYALQKTIKNAGYKAVHIDYRPTSGLDTIDKYSGVRGLFIRVLNKIKCSFNPLFYNKEAIEKFESFRKNMIYITDIEIYGGNLERLNGHYDAFVTGSDQVWSPLFFNPKYFLDFVHDEDKIISYAPSFGVSNIKDKYILERTGELIGRFKYLSVREKQGTDLLKNSFDIDSKVVLDPTLLLSDIEWNVILPPSNCVNGIKYLLIYFIGNIKDNWVHAYKISKKLSLPVKIIPMYKKDYRRKNEVVCDVGPLEFVNLFKNAEFVCTDSFHGTAFSILYNRQFVVYERFNKHASSSQNSRIYNILSMLEINSRLVTDFSEITYDIIKYISINERLSKLRLASLDYLKGSLESVVKTPKTKQVFPITMTCCGCGACASVCNHNALNIEMSYNGFYEVVINQDNCVNCGLCKSVCPFNYTECPSLVDAELYAIKSKNDDVLNRSSSGGAAFEISKYCQKQGFDIVGCVFNKENLSAEHKIVSSDNANDLKMFQGSKYIQSNFYDVISDCIHSNRKVLITGTPCQIAGINKILKLKGIRDSFILIDLICHGVPSYNIFKKGIEYLKNSNIIKNNPYVIFRHKDKSWHQKYISYQDDSTKIVLKNSKDLFYRFFELGNCYSKSCYECPYRVNSCADLRLGDFWGVKYKKDKTGVSEVIVFTEKGHKLLNDTEKSGSITVEKEQISNFNSQQTTNRKRPVYWENLMIDLNSNESLDKLADKYCKPFELKNSLVKSMACLYRAIKPDHFR